MRIALTHKKKNGFHSKHLERLQEVAVCEIFEINLVLVRLCVDCPVLCGIADLLCSSREQDRGKGLIKSVQKFVKAYRNTYLRDDNESNDSEEHGHDQCDPCSPSPTAVTN